MHQTASLWQQIVIIILSAILYFQYLGYRATGNWRGKFLSFGNYHQPILALLLSVDISLCLYLGFKSLFAVATGIAITWMLNKMD